MTEIKPSMILVSRVVAARELGLPIPTFQRYVERGILPRPIPGTHRFHWPSVLAHIERIAKTEAERHA